MTENKTPNYILTRIECFMDGNPQPLIEIFENGINLSKYKESRELIIDLLLDKRPKKRGRELSKDKIRLQNDILCLMAELKGAGFPLINKGSSTKSKSASEIVSMNFSLDGENPIYDPNYIYDKIWKPRRDSDEVKLHLEIGKKCKTNIKSLFG